MKGVGGHDIYKFSSKKKGIYTITFCYKRPWESESIDKYKLIINFDKKSDNEIV